MKNIKLDFKYVLIQVFYCMFISVIVGYASVYLLDKGFKNSTIGIIISSGNILAVLSQQLLARLISKYHALSLKKVISLIIIILLGLSVGLFFLNKNAIVLTFIITLAITLITTLQPFINSLVFEYEKVNITINFGLARGIGSLSYAMTSLILGNIIAKGSTTIIPILYISLSVILFTVLTWFETPYIEEKREEEQIGERVTFKEFLKSNKLFIYMLVASMLLLYDQNIINSFFIQVIKNVNGNISHLGVAMFLAAAVELPTMLLFKNINRKFDCKTLMIVSSISFSIKHVLTYIAPSIEFIYMAQVLQIFGFALFVPTSVYIVKELVSESEMVKGQTLFTGAMTLSSVFASFSGGILIDNLGVSNTLFVGSIISIIGTIIMVYSIRKSMNH